MVFSSFGSQPKSVLRGIPDFEGLIRCGAFRDFHKLEKPFVAFRRLSDTQLELLNSRRVGKKAA